jgi:hypothetical protein
VTATGRNAWRDSVRKEAETTGLWIGLPLGLGAHREP